MSNEKDFETKEENETPSAEELARACHFEVGEPLAAAKIKRLRRALPGYASVLKDAAEALSKEPLPIPLKDVTPEEMSALAAEVAVLRRAESELFAAYRAAYEQRLVADDRAMAAMRRINKLVGAVGDPAMSDRWAFLKEFFGVFAGGRSRKTPDDLSSPSDGTTKLR